MLCVQVEHVERIRPEVAAKGLPNTITESGLAYQMVFVDQDSTGLTRTETANANIGVGSMGDRRGEDVRRKWGSAMSGGRFYASTGITITNIAISGMEVTVETADAEYMVAIVDGGSVYKKVAGKSITFTVDPVHLGCRVTYVRVRASRGPQIPNTEVLVAMSPEEQAAALAPAYDVHSGQQWAWTQPFWVQKDNCFLKTDPRHKHSVESLKEHKLIWMKKLLIDNKDVKYRGMPPPAGAAHQVLPVDSRLVTKGIFRGFERMG